jgi:hypothetical protein
MMKKIFMILMALSVLAMVSIAFAQDNGAAQGAVAAATAQLCPKCGEVAGSAKCCQEGAELCPGCGLHKGSPGCLLKCVAKGIVPPAIPVEVPAEPVVPVPDS